MKGWWGKIAEMAYLIYVLVCLPCVFQLFSSFFFLRLSLFLFNNFPFFFFMETTKRERERKRGENFTGSMEKIESQICVSEI